jgi:hypothetical protein
MCYQLTSFIWTKVIKFVRNISVNLFTSTVYCDQIAEVPSAKHYSKLLLPMTRYCYLLVDVISLSWSQSDHIKQLRLYSKWPQINGQLFHFDLKLLLERKKEGFIRYMWRLSWMTQHIFPWLEYSFSSLIFKPFFFSLVQIIESHRNQKKSTSVC